MYWPTLRPFGRRSEVATSGDDPFTALRREMDRVFESFGRDVGWPAVGSRAGAMAPSMDVSETENELRIEADLPGVDEKDVDVTIADNVLTIRGEKKAEKEEKKKDFHLVERSYGSFSRSLPLPFGCTRASEPKEILVGFFDLFKGGSKGKAESKGSAAAAAAKK